MKVVSVLIFALCILQTIADDHDHDHDHDHSDEVFCECVTNVDCTTTTHVQAAYDALVASTCNTDCSSDTCQNNYYVLVAHHDHCLTELPEEVEKGIHNFEAKCKNCIITREKNATNPDCPAYTCTDTSAADTALTTLNAQCTTACSSTACVDAFRIIRSAHDSCDHDQISEAVEKGIHDFETLCSTAECNAPVSHEEHDCSAAHGLASSAVFVGVIASLALLL